MAGALREMNIEEASCEKEALKADAPASTCKNKVIIMKF
jgi:hypothetical protein